MYYRISRMGYRIDWEPKDKELAEKAMEETKGTDPEKNVPESVTVGKELVELPEQAARRVRHRYAKLFEEKYGHKIDEEPVGDEDEDPEGSMDDN